MKNIRSFMGGLGNRLFQYAFLYSQVRQGKLPDIYLQDYKYFDEFKDELKDILGKDVVKSELISLHIRRGDYVDNPYYVDLTQTDYYDKAIAEFPNEKFLIFCADRQNEKVDRQDTYWCFKWAESKGINFILHNGTSETEDFNRMAGCKGHIMANSSFSFWAAYLGGGKTVAPKKWFSDVRTIPLPDNFIQI